MDAALIFVHVQLLQYKAGFKKNSKFEGMHPLREGVGGGGGGWEGVKAGW